MSLHLEKFNFELCVMSPVHIGMSDKYMKTDFIYDPQKREAGLLDQQKWMDFLNKKGWLDRYIEEMGKAGKAWDNYLFLKRQSIQNPISFCQSLFTTVVSVDQPVNTLNEISRHIKDVHGCPYIPGSSIKGVIRTAVLADLIIRARQEGKDIDQKLSRLWEKMQGQLNQSANRKQDISRMAQSVTKEIESIFFRPLQDSSGKEMKGMLSDPFRGIRVSDTRPFDKDCVMIAKKHDLVVPAGKNVVSEISLWRESIKPGSKTRFSVTLDKRHLQLTGLGHITSANELLACLDSFRSSVLNNHEILLTDEIRNSVIKDQYMYRLLKRLPDQVPVTIGGGTGFQNKSLLYALAPDKEAANKAAEQILEVQFPRKHKGKDPIASPRTIKTTLITDIKGMGDIKRPGRYKLGLCSLRELSDATSS